MCPWLTLIIQKGLRFILMVQRYKFELPLLKTTGLLLSSEETLCFSDKIQHNQIKLLAIVKTLKEFKGMMWGQKMVVYIDHKNLMQDALGLTCDRVYCWRLMLEESGPKIYIKGIHNTDVDAISHLGFGPSEDNKEN